MEIQKILRKELFNLENKFLFHGSPFLFVEAKVNKAKCDTKNPLNEQTAIYASNSLRFAILFDFEKLPKDNFSWKATFKNGDFVGELKNSTYIDENAKGYIYCFDKFKFRETEKGSRQFVCYENLKPETIFEICYKDFKDFFVSV